MIRALANRRQNHVEIVAFPFGDSANLVFFVGNDAALPNVGSCTFMEYYCSARKCSTAFFKTLQKYPKANCGAELSNLKNCMVDTLKVCSEGA